MSDDEGSGRTEPSDRALEGDGGKARLDEIVEALAHRARRYVLYYLQDREVVTVEELAREVAAREAGIPPEEVPTDKYERVATRLVHRHLPKLEDAVLIEYDHRSGDIRYTEPPWFLKRVLRLFARIEGASRE